MSSHERTLGSEIKRLRTEAKITLRKFADTIGISPAHQSDIEHDRRRPSQDVLKRIAKALRSVGATYETLDLLSTGSIRRSRSGWRKPQALVRCSGRSETRDGIRGKF
jgi:transcriptional regulator with XRE-family HTH domain